MITIPFLLSFLFSLELILLLFWVLSIFCIYHFFNLNLCWFLNLVPRHSFTSVIQSISWRNVEASNLLSPWLFSLYIWCSTLILSSPPPWWRISFLIPVVGLSFSISYVVLPHLLKLIAFWEKVNGRKMLISFIPKNNFILIWHLIDKFGCVQNFWLLIFHQDF